MNLLYGKCFIRRITSPQNSTAKNTLLPRFTERKIVVRRGFSRPQLPNGRAGTCTRRSPTPSCFPPALGCTSEKLSHAGTRPARSRGRESRRRRPPQPVPTPGRLPGRPPALTLGVQAATDSSPPLREAAPAPEATYLGVLAAHPAGPWTAALDPTPLAGDAASSSGPSDFQGAHFQAASRETSWEL